ncbi:MAG: sugar ABC transporter ATP-binding protein [Actinomycetota bacterium]|nr:sugar ABC transporter ATP-binding protein [Actinomycetota bacterium]
MADADALRAEQVTKAFGDAAALKSVDFVCASGEVHALLGENGAGKSTLIKIMTGALAPDAGHVSVNGVVHHFRTPLDAQAVGIGVVYQDFQLFPHLTVAENICAVSPSDVSRAGFLSRRRMNEKAAGILASFGVEVDPRREVRSLDAAERKLVEISRALQTDPQYLFLDEPTAALEPKETHRLLSMIDRLRAHGKGVILVTHRLQEINEIADRATALRDGEYAGTLDKSTFSREALSELVVGRAVEQHKGPQHSPGSVRLRLKGLALRADAAPVEITVRDRELVALIGLVGAGVSSVMKVAGGAEPTPKEADYVIDGEATGLRSPADAQARGIGYVSADRKAQGMIPLRSAAENIAMPSLRKLGRGPFVHRNAFREAANTCQQVFDIRWASPDQPVGSLSGGNQQKVMLSRWKVRESTVLVIQEPSQGVDIGARLQIHDYLVDFAKSGGAVLFSSSDLDEVRDIAHRIYVMHAGEIVAEFANDGGHQVSRSLLTQAMAAMFDSEQKERASDE